ncbi:MAG TPA: hypothetical protein VJU78_07835 [Chitinophagaceae bacterium]|nr:hypothetical protein [Chitinophagaceae bacterium]
MDHINGIDGVKIMKTFFTVIWTKRGKIGLQDGWQQGDILPFAGGGM